MRVVKHTTTFKNRLKMPGNPLSDEIRLRIIFLHEEGLSHRQIAERLDINHSTVTRTIQRRNETGSVETRPRSGRPRVTNERQDRYIAQVVRRSRSVTVSSLRSHYQATYHQIISNATIRRRVIATGLRSRRPLRVPRLLPRHRISRLEWGHDHQNWLLPQWSNVLFSDETRIGLVSDDRRSRVWRERGAQQRLALAREVVPYEGGSVMFWGGIMYGRRTALVHVPVTMTGQIYIDLIVRPIVQPIRAEIGPNFLFMDDNARPHRTRAVQEVLREGEIERMEWPALSPDMNPIEHVWDYLSRSIRRRLNPPMNAQELIQAAVEEWNNIPQEFINNLIRGMYRRVHALLQSRGGNTRY